MASRSTSLRASMDRLVAIVLGLDPAVRDIVLIGSAVYAPHLSRDYDVVITTTAPHDAHARLLSALRGDLNDELDKSVDVILRGPGDEIRDLALGLRAGLPLYGNGQTIAEARAFYESAGGDRRSLRVAMANIVAADENLALAATKTDPIRRSIALQTAFDQLFGSARIAALCYLGNDETSQREPVGELPEPLGREFEDMIRGLHLAYAPGNSAPLGEDEIAKYPLWRSRAESFVSEMTMHLVRGQPRPSEQ